MYLISPSRQGKYFIWGEARSAKAQSILYLQIEYFFSGWGLRDSLYSTFKLYFKYNETLYLNQNIFKPNLNTAQ